MHPSLVKGKQKLQEGKDRAPRLLTMGTMTNPQLERAGRGTIMKPGDEAGSVATQQEP